MVRLGEGRSVTPCSAETAAAAIFEQAVHAFARARRSSRSQDDTSRTGFFSPIQLPPDRA